ncbi:hypothetical protein KKB18_13055, partial [bacterium]|nr:hypothetical protein [bacterium]
MNDKKKFSMTRSFLQRKLKKRVKLTTTKNSQNLITVEEKEEGLTLRIHSRFLKAPFSVLESLVNFIKTKDKESEAELKNFIFAKQPQKVSKPEDKKLIENMENISHQGKVYNLKVLFDMLNEKYFDNTISARITWGRSSNLKEKKSIRFGSFEGVKNIIRINPELDKAFVPKFFVGYVIYHEMIHCKLGIKKGK